MTRGGGDGATGVAQTRRVPSFTLSVALRSSTPLDDDAIDRIRAALRPDDPELRVWREPDRAVLRVATECEAADLDAALTLGKDLADEAGAACPGRVFEVAAMDDEDSQVWRSGP
ncbi:hypothetical protein DQ244_10265 [Blastococcus sp. TBT05-19]|nr:hypothetical protein DQ244_10265 [Blastococcus sp. TBT05-19]